MDEKELMMPLELGYVQEVENKEVYFFLTCVRWNICTIFEHHLFKSQVAERNKNQNGGRAATGRGGLLCPLWQETKAVPRCNEGTTALQCCSLV